jgi:hypothetical protein
MTLAQDFTVFASGPTGRVKLGPFDAATALQEARVMQAQHWTSIRFFNAVTHVELNMADMEARFG